MMRIVPFLLLLALPPSLVVAFQSVVVPRDVTVGATGAAAAARRQRHVAVVLSSTDNDDGDDGVENLNEGVSDVNTDTVLMVEDATVLAVDRNVETEKVRAREELMELAEGYQARYGVILLDPKKKQLFQAAVEKLEATIAAASSSITEDDDEDANSSLYASMNDPAMLVGDWTLVCSASYYPNEDKLLENPLLNKLEDFVDTVGTAGGPLRDIQATLIDSLQVIQKITCSTNDNNNNNIDAVDHIIDYKPPNTLSSFVKNLPDVLSDLDINPLKVKDTKIVLKHTAEIKQTLPNIDIKLILKSIVGTCILNEWWMNAMIHVRSLWIESLSGIVSIFFFVAASQFFLPFCHCLCERNIHTKTIRNQINQ